jgi:hypothetical protein
MARRPPGPFPDFSASPTMCALPQHTPSECSTSGSARSGLCRKNGRPVGSAAWSDVPSSSRDRVYVGGFNSPAIQPAATVFIGSLATAFVKLWSHFLHSNVRSSRPSGPGAIPTSIMRPSHFGHPGRRIGSRQGSGRVCSSGMTHSPVDQGGSPCFCHQRMPLTGDD